MLLARAAAALALCAAGVCAIEVIDFDNPAVSFAPPNKWTRVPNGAGSGQVMLCDDPDATITILIPSNASTLQWYAFKTDGPATYLVCIDCKSEGDWKRSFLVDAHVPLATNRTTELWKSQPLDGNTTHTMTIRKAVDPRYNSPPYLLTMDALIVDADDAIPPSGKQISIPALIVGVISGIGCVGLVIALTVFWRRRSRAQQRMRQDTSAWVSEQKRHGQYVYSSVRKAPVMPDSPDTVLDIHEPLHRNRDTTVDADTASHIDRSDLPAGAIAPRAPAANSYTAVPSFQNRPPLRSTETGHTVQASASSHISVLSPRARADSTHADLHRASENPEANFHSKIVAKPVQATIRYRDPFGTRPPPPPTTDAYVRPWTAQETPPPPTKATFLDAHLQSHNAPDIPPLPYTLPPTRPSSQSTGQTSVSESSIGDLPLPEFLSPKATEFPSPPSSARVLSNTIRPVRRPGGPRIPPNDRTRSSSLGMANFTSIPEEGVAGSVDFQRLRSPLPDDFPLSPNVRADRPLSKQLPPTPIASSPLSGPSQKGKAPAKWPDAIAGSSIVIPAFKFAPGMRPRRRSTGSTPTSPDTLSRLPSLITWEPDFLEFESTPEGTMVTVRSKGSKGSTDSANSPLVHRPLAPIPAVDDSPVDIGEDWDDGEREDGVLTVSHTPTTPNSTRRRSYVSSATHSSGNRFRGSIPGPYDIATAVRRVLGQETPRRIGPDYEQLP